MGEELLELLPDNDDVSSQDSIWNLSLYIPGVEAKEQPEECVFQQYSAEKSGELVLKKRIGSPVHSRVYFAFTIPKTSMSDRDWDELQKLADEDTAMLTTKLVELAENRRPIGGSWFAYVVDRLDIPTLQNMSAERLAGWVTAISNSMDDVLKKELEPAGFALSTAGKTKFMVQRLIKILREKNANLAEQAITDIFKTSPSISWLVGEWFRQELFDHGLVGDRSRPDDCALTGPEIKQMREVLKSRLKDKQVEPAIGSFPALVRFLYGWRDLAGIRSPKAWVKQHITDDLEFLKLLLAMTSWSASDKVYYPLNKSNVEMFIDWEATVNRVKELNNSTNSDISLLAKNVLDSIALGEKN